MPEAREQIPAPTEEVHLPDPTYLPAVVALGLTFVVVGVVVSWIVFGIGVAIFLVATLLWIRDTRRDISRLPLEH